MAYSAEDEFMRLLEDEKMRLWLSQLQLEYHDPWTVPLQWDNDHFE